MLRACFQACVKSDRRNDARGHHHDTIVNNIEKSLPVNGLKPIETGEQNQCDAAAGLTDSLPQSAAVKLLRIQPSLVPVDNTADLQVCHYEDTSATSNSVVTSESLEEVSIINSLCCMSAVS